MNAERWGRVSELFDAACELPPDRRKVFLDECCQGDAELRCEVESLLNQNVSSDSALERAAEQALAWDSAGRSERHVPRTVGHYRIHRLVGEGGMGVVYEAEQENPRRRVALKVLRSALASPELLRRFAQESEVLGRLQHPGIARIYEAGAADTELGPQPYFAMEFIPGSSLLEYAGQRQLSTRERVKLMIKVCEGVDHAHQHGIIHRDLKPGNILVDESGQPKILDFGVARITDNDANLTRQTNLGELVGTLAYMSPEQLLADPQRLDGRSDVYSLGVVLYQLLTGRLPYEVGRDVFEGARAIRERDPAPLRELSRADRPDLEVIFTKALEKDKAQRYASAAELAADLERFLNDKAILARPPNAVYRARKFVARHKALVAATLTVFLVMLAATIVSTAQAIRANRERDRAVAAEDEAKAVNDFLLNDLLGQAGARAQADAHGQPDPDLKVRTTLDRAAERIAGKFDAQPLVEAAIRRTIGLAYFDLTLFAQAQPQLERTVELRKRLLGAQHPDTLTSMDELGVLYTYQAKYASAEALLTQVLEARKRSLGNDHKNTLATMADLGTAISYQGDDARAAPLLIRALEAERRLEGEDHPDTLSLMDDLGTVYVRLGKYPEAEALLESEVERNRRVLGPEHPNTFNSMQNLATAYRLLGKYGQADMLYRAVLEGRLRAFGEEHWETQNTRFSLGVSYRAQGKFSQARLLLTQSVQALSRVLGREHPLTLQAIYHLAELDRRQGRFAEAEFSFNKVLEARRRVLGQDNPYTAQVLTSLGAMELERHAYTKAEKLLHQAVEAREKRSPDSWERYWAESLLGASLDGLGHRAEASPLLHAGYQGMIERQSTIPAEDRDDLERARRWRDQLALQLSGRGTPLAAAARHLAQ